MTTLAIIFCSIIALGFCAVALACWSADRKTRNAFDKSLRDAWKVRGDAARRRECYRKLLHKARN